MTTELLRKSGSELATAPGRAGQLPERPSRVLIADDEYLVATDVAFALGTLGYTVVGPATDGASALQLARLALPDLAILDIRMPGMDGISAAREMHRELDIPIIMLSAFSDPETVRAATDAGIFGYIVKPVAEDQLRVCIDVAWKRYSDHVAARSEVEDLRRRLEDRKVIEQAKWILVSRKNIAEPEAMKLLQRRARETRKPLAEIADTIIKADALL
jgi:AmiR/NasT family two-component response regulator